MTDEINMVEASEKITPYERRIKEAEAEIKALDAKAIKTSRDIQKQIQEGIKKIRESHL